MAEEPRSKLPRSDSHMATEVARLQYFLDTQMKEEPALGLEYIVEEQLTSDKFRYTCRLCCAEGDMNWIFVHIVGKKHMLRYIEKHHHPSIFANRPLNHNSTFQEVRDRALSIQNIYGRKEIKRAQSKVNQDKPASSPLSESQRVCRKCPICNLFFCSAWTLCHHLMGGKHRKTLRRFAPGEVRHLARMQYVLDNFVKEDPALGLEYVVERLESGSYRYTCSLCEVEGDLFQSLIHVVGDDHMERYIRKHHSSMLPEVLPSTNKNEYARQLRESALTIQRKYGSNYIQIDDSCVSDPSLLEAVKPSPVEEAGPSSVEEDGPSLRVEGGPSPMVEDAPLPTEEDGPLPAEEDGPSPTEEARPSLTVKARPLPLKDVNEETGPFLHDGEGLDNCHPCRLCSMEFPSPVGLWNHVVGSKHKEMLRKNSPKDLKELGRLQYFLNNHMKKAPLLGLEYIVEEQLDSTSYKYTCQLCNVEGDLPRMITHISYVDHVERYIDKDHCDLSLRVYTYPERADYIEALTKIAFIILDRSVRQEIILKCK